MNKKILIALALIVVIVGITIVLGSFVNSETDQLSTGLSYHSSVCVYKNNELVQCSPNALTNAGKNALRSYAAHGGTLAAFDYIALANNTPEGNHAVTDTDLDNRTTCCGLTIAQGTVTDLATDGNWTISKVFTCATEAVSEVNATGIFNASSPGTYFAYNTFSPVDLQIDDQINVTWTIWVT